MEHKGDNVTPTPTDHDSESEKADTQDRDHEVDIIVLTDDAHVCKILGAQEQSL